MEPQLSWFFTFGTEKTAPRLWAGVRGKLYANSCELEPVTHGLGLEALNEVFMRQVAPYSDFLLSNKPVPIVHPGKYYV